jgi:hypothetical protein
MYFILPTIVLQKIIDHSHQQQQLVPAIRDVLRHYSRAEYGQCLTLLHGTIKHDLLLDMHLHSHVPVLLDMIRDRCITQYLVPYSCVSIEKMGRVFGYTACNMESIVAKLLLNGELGNDNDERSGKVRINARDGTLTKESTSLGEKKALRKARVLAMKMGRQFTRETEGVLLRVMCMESGLVTQQSSDNKRSIGWRSSNNRVGGGGRPHRDGGGSSSGRSIPNESMGSDLFEESDEDIDDIDDDDDDDGSISHDDMDVDNHNIVNPNEY